MQKQAQAGLINEVRRLGAGVVDVIGAEMPTAVRQPLQSFFPVPASRCHGQPSLSDGPVLYPVMPACESMQLSPSDGASNSFQSGVRR